MLKTPAAFALVLAVNGLGCGPSTSVGTDAGHRDAAQADAGADAALIDVGRDGGAEPVSVVVLDVHHAPLSGIEVVFHDVSGAVLDVGSTDTAGQVTSTAGATATVTAIYGLQLYSMTAVVGSTTVTFDGVGIGATATHHVQLPHDFVGATTSTVYSPCGLPVTGSGDAVLAACDWAGAVNLLALAQDASGSALAYSALIDAPDVGFGIAPLPAWRTDFQDVSVTLTGVPADAFGAYVGGAVVQTDLGDVPCSDTTGSSARVIADAPRVVFPAYASAPFPGGLMQTIRSDATFLSPLPGTITLDLSSAPRLDGIMLDHPSDPNPSLTWWETGANERVRLRVQYSASAGDVTWVIYAVPTATSISVPTLPADAADRGIPAGAPPSYELSIAHVATPRAMSEIMAHPMARLDDASYAILHVLP